MFTFITLVYKTVNQLKEGGSIILQCEYNCNDSNCYIWCKRELECLITRNINDYIEAK